MALMKQARENQVATGAGFKRPNVRAFTPKGMQDAVDRVSAAGQKVMYDPAMREQLMAKVSQDAPVTQKLATSVTQLLFLLNSKSNGGIPKPAMFPAAMDLLGEAADTLTAAGTPVTQEEFNDAAQLLFVMIAKKLGAPDDQIMAAGQQIAGGGAPAPQGPPVDEEQQAMDAGMMEGA